MLKTLNLVKIQKLAKKTKPVILKERIMYKVEQDNKMHKCLTTSRAQIVLEELHEGVVRRHFIAYITAKKILVARYWWLTLFKDTHEFCRNYNSYQKIGRLKTKSLAQVDNNISRRTFYETGSRFYGSN